LESLLSLSASLSLSLSLHLSLSPSLSLPIFLSLSTAYHEQAFLVGLVVLSITVGVTFTDIYFAAGSPLTLQPKP
jgi:hypothetical protein